MPQVSVVVPARNAAESLPTLLRSLAAQTLPAESFEVIVVDNGSTDATARRAREAGARVVVEREPNRSLARNRGIAAASSGLLAFTDADCVATPGWLEAIVGCLAQHPLVAGPIRLCTATPPNRVERLESLWRFQQERNVVADGWAPTANLGARREALDAVGGFDPAYRIGGEDVDLCRRTARAGYALGFCPDAELEHPMERRWAPALRRALARGHSGTQLHRRLHGAAGRVDWRHPGPLVRGDWALRRFHVDPAALAPSDRTTLLRLARVDYAARMAGSLWAELSRAR